MMLGWLCVYSMSKRNVFEPCAHTIAQDKCVCVVFFLETTHSRTCSGCATTTCIGTLVYKYYLYFMYLCIYIYTHITYLWYIYIPVALNACRKRIFLGDEQTFSVIQILVCFTVCNIFVSISKTKKCCLSKKRKTALLRLFWCKRFTISFRGLCIIFPDTTCKLFIYIYIYLIIHFVTRNLKHLHKRITWLILPVVICLSQRLSHAFYSFRGAWKPGAQAHRLVADEEEQYTLKHGQSSACQCLKCLLFLYRSRHHQIAGTAWELTGTAAPGNSACSRRRNGRWMVKTQRDWLIRSQARRSAGPQYCRVLFTD